MKNTLFIGAVFLSNWLSGYFGYHRGYAEGSKVCTVMFASSTPAYKEVSILKEKKDCEAKGGYFTITQPIIWVKQEGHTDMMESDYTLTCSRPSEILSEIRI